jgi:Tol biopolymer transport system component
VLRVRPWISAIICLLTIGAWGAAASVAPRSASASAEDYAVVGVRRLLSTGGRVAWSPAGQWLFHDALGADGYWDVYRVASNGTGALCVTCDRTDLPSRNKGNPAVHPSGRYLVFQAEKEVHATTLPGATAPGAGHFNDLWALDLTTGAATRLTDVRRDGPSGSLHPQFNRDGTKLLWTDLEAYAGTFGDFRLVVASFNVAPQPALSGLQYLNPGPQPRWLESQGWAPDDLSVYFSCTPVAGMADENMDVCLTKLATPTMVSRLTFSGGLSGQPGEWDEHAKLTPRGDAFSWMSSTPYGTTPGTFYRQWLKTDLWLMNTNGTGKRRLTYFNEPGRPEFQGERVIVADHTWHPAGNQVALYLQFFESNRHEIWLLDVTR